MRTEQDARRDPRPTDRDTTPQPPPDWLEKWQWAEKRIAALEAQLAEAQARLAELEKK